MSSTYSAVVATLLTLAAAQSTTTTDASTTATLFVPLESIDQYAASIVNVCSSSTTWALACTENCDNLPVRLVPSSSSPGHLSWLTATHRTTPSLRHRTR